MNASSEKELKRLEREIKDEYEKYFDENKGELMEELTEEQLQMICEIEPAYSVSVELDITFLTDFIHFDFTIVAKHKIFLNNESGEPIVVRVESSAKMISEICKSLFVSLEIGLESIIPQRNDDLVCEVERDRKMMEEIPVAEGR